MGVTVEEYSPARVHAQSRPDGDGDPMAKGPTTEAAIHEYLRERSRLSWAPTTTVTARWVLLDFVKFAPPLMQSVRRKHVVKWLTAARRGRVLAPSTQRTRLSTLRAFGDWAVEQRYAPGNPTRGVLVQTERRRKPRSVPPDSPPSIIDVCLTSRQKAIVLTSLHLGLRRAECAGAMIEDLDIDRRVLFVVGKGGFEDWLPMPLEALDAVTEYLSEYPAQNGPLFRSFTTGRALTPAWIGRLVSRTLYDAGVKVRAYDGMTMHSLRHRFTLDVLESVRDPNLARKATRHRSWSGFQPYTDATVGVETLREIIGERTYATPRPATGA
ncbi:MAG: tyrosine-type recombinase/integrase [Actinomycetota bacterium]